MRAFVITILCLHCAALLQTIYRIGANKYPRQKTEDHMDAAITLVIAGGFIGWAIYVLSN